MKKSLCHFKFHKILNQVQDDRLTCIQNNMERAYYTSVAGMTRKEDESGRTMLEMLGVLAIMGIITYGAIAGINYGMSSYKINQTYNEVQDIIRGVEDLYSWSKEYPDADKMMDAACKNDVFAQECYKDSADSKKLKAKGAFGTIEIRPTADNKNFLVQISLRNRDECDRLTSMSWDSANIECENPNGEGCDCDQAPNDSILLNFSPK